MKTFADASDAIDYARQVLPSGHIICKIDGQVAEILPSGMIRYSQTQPDLQLRKQFKQQFAELHRVVQMA